MDTDRVGLTTEARQFIARKELGDPARVYAPPTGAMILMGMVILGCAAFVAWMASLNTKLSENGLAALLFFVAFAVLLGLAMIVVAFANRTKRAVICTHGAALFTAEGAVSFHWEEVLTTTCFAPPGRELTYTVHCHDGRSILFNNLSGIRDLVETIDVEVAHTKQP